MPQTAATWLIAAILAQGMIAFVLLWVLGTIRVPMVASGRMPIPDIALSRDPWPAHEKRISNAFDNQFQLPVLFYVACGLALYFGPSWIEVIIAWGFVVARVAHATIFATTNNVVQRFSAYTACFAILVIFWIDLIIRLVFAGGVH